MAYRRTLLELLHSVTSVVAAAAAFGAAAWAYPQGYPTIWNIGFVTMAAIAGMGLPELVASWRADRAEYADG